MEAVQLWAGVSFSARGGHIEGLLNDAAGAGLQLAAVVPRPGGFDGRCAACICNVVKSTGEIDSILIRSATDTAYHGGEKLKLKPELYKAVIDGMKAAVERGTCRRAAVEGISMAAKSGTAQVSVSGKKLTLAWMVAFAPVENPQVAISVVVEGEEVGDASGGRTAGPIVGTALKKYFETSPLFPKVGNAENAAD